MTADTPAITETTEPNTNDQQLYTLVLGAEIGIADAKGLFTDLDGLLKEYDVLVIDASSVESIDTSVLQLLIVAVRDHSNLSCKNPSEVFCKTAGLLGLEKYLGLE